MGRYRPKLHKLRARTDRDEETKVKADRDISDERLKDNLFLAWQRDLPPSEEDFMPVAC